MARYWGDFATLVLFLYVSIHSTSIYAKVDETLLEKKVVGQGAGLLLLSETAREFRYQALSKYRTIIRERGEKEAEKLRKCRQNYLLGIAQFDCFSAAFLPAYMRNQLQTEMLDGAGIYIREIRQPLLQLLGSTLVETPPQAISDIAQVVRVWRRYQITTDTEQPTRLGQSAVRWNPNDLLGRLYLLNYKVRLAAAIELFDTYELVLSKYLFDDEMRKALRYMDKSDQEIGEALLDIWESVEDGSLLNELAAAIRFYDSMAGQLPGRSRPEVLSATAADLEEALDRHIHSSVAYQYVHRNPGKLLNRNGLARWWNSNLDLVKSLARESLHSVSAVVGNTLGRAQCRQGLLHQVYVQKPDEISVLESRMKAGDILLEKTPFRMTDNFIPGHYGHVAIWLGSRKELQQLGVWELLPDLHRELVQYHNYPESPTLQELVDDGFRIVEALRDGVQLNSLEHFIDIDDLAVIRPRGCMSENTANDPNLSGCFTREELRQAVINSIRQLGKSYDFAFDVYTKDKIVCSELAYQAYTELEFDITPSLGSMASISPDQVAVKADGDESGKEGPDAFYPAVVIHNGTDIQGSEQQLKQVFRKLLDASDESYAWVYRNTSASPVPPCPVDEQRDPIETLLSY